MKNLTFSKLSLSLTALALLAVFGLAGCGSGGDGGDGGGSNTVDNPLANSTTAVVNQSGGAIALADGTTVTFVAGLVKDGTNVTVSSTTQPTSVATQEVQALSPTIVIDVPPDSLLATAPADSVITIEIPVTGNATQNLVAGLSSTSAKVDVLGTVNDFVQVVVQSPGGKIATYYSKLIVKSSGKIVVSIGIDKLCQTAYGNLACIASKAIIAAFDATQCAQQTTTLYQVDFLSGKFDTNIQPNGKPPLILVHGWQELAIIGAISSPFTGYGCDKPYTSTWQSFLKEYSLAPAILDKFQVFSLAYNTSFPIFGDFGTGATGSEFAQVIKGQFGQEAVYVVAHSMGGIVARTALVNYGANIKGLVTLATPHHGSPLASQEGVDMFGSTPLYPLIDYVIGGQGIMDLAWLTSMANISSMIDAVP